MASQDAAATQRAARDTRPIVDEVLELLGKSAPAAAAASDDDVQYVLLELPRGRDSPTLQEGEKEIVLQDLHTSEPTLRIGGQTHPAEFVEDVGSTLVFDRKALRHIAESGSEPEQRRRPPQESLVCVTTKRLRPRGVGS